MASEVKQMSGPMRYRKTVAIVAIIGIVALMGIVRLTTGHWPLATDQSSSRTVYYCPMHPSYTSDRPGDCPICNMRLVKKEAQGSGVGAQGQSMLPRAQSPEPRAAKEGLKDICYRHDCPMMKAGKPCPMLVIAKAGEKVTCPVCGTHVTQTVEPEEIPAGYQAILLTPQKRRLIGVKTEPVEQRQLTKTIRSAGRIAYDPELYQAEEGYLQTVRAYERAKQGSIPEVAEQAKRLVESSRMRLRLLGLSDELISEMVTWEGPDRRLIAAEPGGEVWVYAPVYEYELALVKPGQAVSVELPSAPGRAFTGTIRAVDPVLDPQTRTVRVRAVLPNPDRALKPEMYVTVTIEVTLGQVLAVREEAVMHTGTQQIVFVDRGQGVLEPRQVVLGAKAGGFYEVKSGLAPGEIAVTSGNFLIDSESRLKAALEGMATGEGHQHGP